MGKNFAGGARSNEEKVLRRTYCGQEKLHALGLQFVIKEKNGLQSRIYLAPKY